MRWVLRIAGALVVVVILVFLVGLRVPETHTASVTDTVPGTQAEVWNAITDVQAFPSWRSGVDRVVRLEDRNGLPVWREEGTMGRLTLQVVWLEPPERMVGRIAEADGPFGGSWTWDLAPVETDRTQVTITEEGEIYSAFFRFVARYVMGYEGTIRAFLADLEDHMAAESGA